MSSKLHKNYKLKSISPNLYDINYIASFFGITLNAIYLRIHFDNFPKAIKINGKLYFDLNDVLAYFKKDDEEEAFCFLVRDEIRTMVDTGRVSRMQIGQMLKAKNPSVVGGAVYLRNIGKARAIFLRAEMIKSGIKLDFDENRSFAEQKKERLEYIYDVWDMLLKLVDSKKITKKEIGGLVCTVKCGYIGKSILETAPSYKIAKIIKLKLVQQGVV